MDEYLNNFYIRKLEHIKKDYETAFASYERHSSHIVSIRSWSIALVVAYMGLITTFKRGFDLTLALPAIVIIIGFYFLEAIQKSFCMLNSSNIREIDILFLIEDSEKFLDAIKNYNFRNLKIKNESTDIRVKRYFFALRNKQTFVWYIFLLLSFATIHVVIWILQ
jgi:hypothetical protein